MEIEVLEFFHATAAIVLQGNSRVDAFGAREENG
jgi:hypothetical protein